MLELRPLSEADLLAATAIWNEVVEDGIAFPQTNCLTVDEARAFFAAQSRTTVALLDGQVAGLSIVHPNNVGRCGHIANASYAVSGALRGQHIGEALVKDSLAQAKALGFRVMQFNAVVATNSRALALYRRLGFQPLGVIPGGFLMKDGHYEDICPMFYPLG